MVDGIRTGDPVGAAARVAARWWREAIDRTIEQNTGNGLIDALIGLVGAREPRAPGTTFDRFEATLRSSVGDCLRRCGRVRLDVDCGPCQMLAEAWRHAGGGHVVFPLKTHMSVAPGDVTVSCGYRAPIERLLGTPVWTVEAYRPPLDGARRGEFMDIYHGNEETEARRLYAVAAGVLPEGGVTSERRWRSDVASVILHRDGTDASGETGR